ncbi:hypothetical protein GYMLUDRAFT_81662 [Collybiopsis luxurians FD-317 M1]|nr:hypothetical protein GYMLUDRAFT_81662 [Collybiopsis luxurians FD-317 M1]
MNESGDDYIRRIAAFVRNNERNLAELSFVRRRAPRRPADNTGPAFYNPLSWFGGETSATAPPPKSTVMSIDTHHLFYLLIRMEALNLPVGTLDVRVDSPSRPLSYVNLFPDADKTETLSLSSFRSSFSAVSTLSLGVGWWGRPEPPSVDTELKFIYSSFTKLPALSITAPTRKMIAELATDPPNENAIPMDSFKNLQSLECSDIDPRSLLGWDNLAESLLSLKIQRSGLEDISDVFIGAVLDDQARRAGSTTRKRIRRIPRGPERQTSFYSSQVPETVPEANDEEASPSPTAPTPASQLSSRKWASLRFLSLTGNDLTFFPIEPVSYLTSITHLDLSSNLLNSVPEGLSALFNLVSLNLCDNMIESVLGIYTTLGSVTFINLSRNRLESICGLERLHALERVDLRGNSIEDSAEIGRLAPLPNISDVWVEGNPFTEYEENYRVTCFDLFWKEGKTIMLDGSPPSFYEKRKLTVASPEHMNASRPVSAAYSPPTVAIGAHSHSLPSSPPPEHAEIVNNLSTATSPSASSAMSPPAVLGVSGKGRKKKQKRIVDLDGEHGSDDAASFKGGHRRTTSNGSNISKHKSSSKKVPKDREMPPAQPVEHQSFGQFVSLLAIPHNLPAAMASSSVPSPVAEQPELVETVSPSSPSTSSKPAPQLTRKESEFQSATRSSRPNRKSRHTRYQTDFGSAGGDSDESEPAAFSSSSEAINPARRLRQNSQTFSSARAAARRARVTASLYEPPTVDGQGAAEENAVVDEADAFRRKIEALKKDMGDGWLKIFSQTQMKTPSPS